MLYSKAGLCGAFLRTSPYISVHIRTNQPAVRRSYSDEQDKRQRLLQRIEKGFVDPENFEREHFRNRQKDGKKKMYKLKTIFSPGFAGAGNSEVFFTSVYFCNSRHLIFLIKIFFPGVIFPIQTEKTPESAPSGAVKSMTCVCQELLLSKLF